MITFVVYAVIFVRHLGALLYKSATHCSCQSSMQPLKLYIIIRERERKRGKGREEKGRVRVRGGKGEGGKEGEERDDTILAPPGKKAIFCMYTLPLR